MHIFFSLFKIIVNILATMLNKNIDIVSPYRRPFLSKRYDLVANIYDYTTPDMNESTHFIHLGEKPFMRSAWKRNNHFTLL